MKIATIPLEGFGELRVFLDPTGVVRIAQVYSSPILDAPDDSKGIALVLDPPTRKKLMRVLNEIELL